ncbi:MAG TPA: hypothetical protein VJC10_00665 [Patescibacteria group bacterium]|nr:hypothetical protein [Patescibacteria group bacterium]
MDEQSSTAPKVSSLAQLVIDSFEERHLPNHEKKINVNPIVSKFASWYEKVRNAMEYREDEVILRAAIERVLRRRLLLGGNAKTTAEPLVRELLWARYMPEGSLPESIIPQVEEVIDFYLQLRFKVLEKHRIPEGTLNEWIYHFISSAVEHMINPNHEKETMSNFMFQVLRDDIILQEEPEQTRSVQVYIAVRKAFDRDDLAFLRYHLFLQYFGKVTDESIEHVAAEFLSCFREIQKQLTYPGKEKIYSYVRKRAAVFIVLEDILRVHKGSIAQLVSNPDLLEKAVIDTCDLRYKGISSKVKRAIVRSVAFILLTKVIFAFMIEGTYERLVYGQILWTSIIVNTSIPPLLMIIVSLFIRTPKIDNSKRILSYILTLLYEEKPRLGSALTIRKKPEKKAIHDVFNILWFFAFILSFGSIVIVLTSLRFNIASQGVFIFFLAIVSFLSYRISLMANTFSVGERQGLITPLVDFLFMPVVRVGRRLTLEISKFNFLIFFVDFIIETPFKVVFGFLDQWFHFLHNKREELD